MKRRSEATQTLRAGCSKAEPKIFAPPQTPFPGARDGQNLISWRWALPLPTNPIWWGSIHAISSYRGTDPQTNTHTHTNKQGRLQYTAPQLSAQHNNEKRVMNCFCHSHVSLKLPRCWSTSVCPRNIKIVPTPVEHTNIRTKSGALQPTTGETSNFPSAENCMWPLPGEGGPTTSVLYSPESKKSQIEPLFGAKNMSQGSVFGLRGSCSPLHGRVCRCDIFRHLRQAGIMLISLAKWAGVLKQYIGCSTIAKWLAAFRCGAKTQWPIGLSDWSLTATAAAAAAVAFRASALQQTH